MIRNRLKYALTGAEVKKIVMQRLIKVDGKVRTDTNYPAGFMGMIFYFIYYNFQAYLFCGCNFVSRFGGGGELVNSTSHLYRGDQS